MPHLAVTQRRERQVVEQVGEELPYVGMPVLSMALVIEPVPVGNRT
jgi:hypothetical protein